MPITRRSLVASTALAAAFAGRQARAAGRPTIKLGVLTDMSGTYSAETGRGSVACTEQAAVDSGEEFFGATPHGVTIEVISADHQNKPDLGVSIARQWFDREGVDAIVDGAASSVALAVNTVVKQKNKVFLDSSSATPDLTGKACTPNTVHWPYDTYMLGRSTGETLVKSGGDSWYFMTADYVFGHDLQASTTEFVKAGGGKVLGASAYPFPATTDFSSYLVRAKASGAKVIGLANAGTDTQNCVKQAHEFDVLTGGTRLAALLMVITDVHALGLAMTSGLVLTESFYWDLNDGTRAFTNRVLPQMPFRLYPNMFQAGCYSMVRHYLRAVAALGAAAAKENGAAAISQMKKMPVEDDVFGKTTIRADGRHLVPAYLFDVKSPAESKAPWDYYKLLATTPADEAAVPLSQTGCYLDHT
ncbi:MAG: ABC transporter substrate-binding protein [Acetobacteraceae bacterium]